MKELYYIRNELRYSFGVNMLSFSTQGSYKCSCPFGYRGPEVGKCRFIGVCEEKKAKGEELCGPNAECISRSKDTHYDCQVSVVFCNQILFHYSIAVINQFKVSNCFKNVTFWRIFSFLGHFSFQMFLKSVLHFFLKRRSFYILA